jgi:hypothetical protein
LLESIKVFWKRCEAGTLLKRSIRYLLAIIASSIAGAASLVLGLLAGKFAVEHGFTNGYVTAVTISMIGVILLPTIIVKKLLVDYW